MQVFEAARATGVVDQNVHPTQAFQGRLAQLLGSVFGVHVLGDQNGCLAASGHDGRSHGLEFVQATRRQSQLHALGRQGQGNAFANAHRGTGDQSGFVVELHVHGVVLWLGCFEPGGRGPRFCEIYSEPRRKRLGRRFSIANLSKAATR